MKKIAKNKIAKVGTMEAGTMVLILLLMTIILIPQISAKPQYLTALQSKYGDGSCTDCHTDPNGGKLLTDYGTNFKSQPNYKNDPVAAVVAIGPPGGSVTGSVPNATVSPTAIETVAETKDTAISPTETVAESKETVAESKETVAESKETNEKEEKEEEENEKEETMTSPGFDIVITVGIISMLYIFRNKIRKN